MKPADQFRLLELSERYADEKLSAAEVAALETELRENAEARTFFAKALHQRAELCFDDSWHTQASHAARPTAKPVWWRHAITAAAAACVTFGFVWLNGTRDGTVATLIRAQQCQWAGSSLPTVEGARLKPGMLDLIEGLAVLRFDSGAELVLEAPATVEVLDGMNCKLRRGTLVAEGTPQEFLLHGTGLTAQALREYEQSLQDTRGRAAALIQEAATALPAIAPTKAIQIHHAREHNLKNIDVSIPWNKFTVITGVSGSGKSTLAFDIIFGEGQRRQVAALRFDAVADGRAVEDVEPADGQFLTVIVVPLIAISVAFCWIRKAACARVGATPSAAVTHGVS